MSIMYLVYCLASGVMIALCTRVGNVLPISESRAKEISFWGTVLSCIVFFIVGVTIYLLPGPIIGLFTQDEDIVNGCKAIWLDLVIFCFNSNLFFVLSGIATALGMQWAQGIVSAVCLFGLGLPLIYYNAIRPDDGSIEDLWRWQWPPYCVINFVIIVLLVRADWGQIATFVRIREGMIPPSE
jgi:Na+-driven multidrug efflux pump